MNTNIKISLGEIPTYDSNEVITTTIDGSPLSYVFDIWWDFSGVEARATGKTSRVSFKETDELYRRYSIHLSLHFQKI